MLSRNNRVHHFHILSEDILIVRYVIAAISLSFIDLAIPLPLPGIKPGLANIVVLVALTQLGWSKACWVAILRVFAVSLVIGTFLTPSFWLSLIGSIFSLFALRAALWLPRKYFGPLSQSMLAAFAHMLGQLLLVHLLLLPIETFLPILPIFFGFALFTGIINGLASSYILSMLHHSTEPI